MIHGYLICKDDQYPLKNRSPRQNFMKKTRNQTLIRLFYGILQQDGGYFGEEIQLFVSLYKTANQNIMKIRTGMIAALLGTSLTVISQVDTLKGWDQGVICAPVISLGIRFEKWTWRVRTSPACYRHLGMCMYLLQIYLWCSPVRIRGFLILRIRS
jgi:hypothetical protein